MSADEEWEYVDCGPRPHLTTLWQRCRLWFVVVGRDWHGCGRIGPALAWKMASGIRPWGERVKRWGVVR